MGWKLINFHSFASCSVSEDSAILYALVHIDEFMDMFGDNNYSSNTIYVNLECSGAKSDEIHVLAWTGLPSYDVQR